MSAHRVAVCLAGLLCWLGPCAAQSRSAADTGAPQVSVVHSGDTWTIAGRKNAWEINEKSLAIAVHAGPAVWKMVPSAANDMLIAAGGDQFRVRLADAGRIAVTPYETGYKSGVRMVLDGFRGTGLLSPGSPLNLRLVMTVCLGGGDEELIFEAMVNELGPATVEELH